MRSIMLGVYVVFLCFGILCYFFARCNSNRIFCSGIEIGLLIFNCLSSGLSFKDIVSGC